MQYVKMVDLWGALMNNTTKKLAEELFYFLTYKYVQRADERQKAMGLQYTEAETHDLAETIAGFISSLRGEQDKLGEGEPVAWPDREAVEVLLSLVTNAAGDLSDTLVARNQEGGPFGYGSSVWPGVAKVIEECGEVQQVCGKLIATGGGLDHWDGTNLRHRLQEEIADLQAALEVVIRLNNLDAVTIYTRATSKRDTFLRWQIEEAEKLSTYKDPDQ